MKILYLDFLVYLFFYLIIFNNNAFGCTGKRIECTGGFVVCSFPHFMHASCYDRWNKGCPLCTKETKDPIQEVYTDTIYLKPDDEDYNCAICTIGCHEKSETYFSNHFFTPTAPPLDVIAPVLHRPESFYDKYQALQYRIRNAQSASVKKNLILQLKEMQNQEFKYSKK